MLHATLRRCAGALALILLAGNGLAAPPSVEDVSTIGFGSSLHFHSAVLDETRTLNVLLPPGYDMPEAASRTYPVIYLLDGAVDEDYLHVAGLVQFLTTYELMPPSILVGIANTDRTRDMTFPSQDPRDATEAPTHGGSARFREFLAREVRPLVEQRFRTDDRRLLIGQSLAGLLATELFVEEPELFDDYVIVSPSLWWDRFSLVGRIAPAVAAHPDLAARVCIAVGDEGPGMEGPAHAFAAALAADAPPTLEWHYLPLPGETHATTLHRALYRAFEWLYGDEYPGL